MLAGGIALLCQAQQRSAENAKLESMRNSAVYLIILGAVIGLIATVFQPGSSGSFDWLPLVALSFVAAGGVLLGLSTLEARRERPLIRPESGQDEPPARGRPSNDLVVELERLAALRERDALSEQEYQAAKRKLLDIS